MFGVWLCCMCSTVKTCPYFLERVFSGQKDGNVCKKRFSENIFSLIILFYFTFATVDVGLHSTTTAEQSWS